MIGTEFFKGAGLGNQLFSYITMRAVAEKKGCKFGIINPQYLANNIHNNTGMYFMDIDLGENIPYDEKESLTIWKESNDRLYLANSHHDMTNGIYIGGRDDKIDAVEDGTLIYGNLQDESYFEEYIPKIKEWLKVKEEYDSYEYCQDNLCVIHMRCGDYIESPELWLERRYWINGIENMKKIRADMEFLIVTDDVQCATSVLPGIKAVTNDIGKDYAILKNAKYLLLSNSSFAVIPAFSSDVLIKAIAPKYWARHNVSSGYWSAEQNIYSIFTYQDRKGRLFSAEECREELNKYKQKSFTYKFFRKKPNKLKYFIYNMYRICLYKVLTFRNDISSI